MNEEDYKKIDELYRQYCIINQETQNKLDELNKKIDKFLEGCER